MMGKRDPSTAPPAEHLARHNHLQCRHGSGPTQYWPRKPAGQVERRQLAAANVSTGTCPRQFETAESRAEPHWSSEQANGCNPTPGPAVTHVPQENEAHG